MEEEDEKQKFNAILKGLDLAGINYQLNENLVRGLDYYTGLVFEFVSNDPNLEGKSTIMGGGRYGKLISNTGGPDSEGIGFAIGIERLIIAIESINPSFFRNESNFNALVASENKESDLNSLLLSQKLRNANYKICTYLVVGNIFFIYELFSSFIKMTTF